jgi:hypothetical protein
MHVDPDKLGFRMKIKNAYLVYALFSLLILLPLLALTHTVFEKVDFHLSIIGTVVVTSAFFIGFQYFHACIKDKMALKRIKEAWEIHFPYFPYEKYTKEVENIYNEAIKKEISSKELKQYVLDRLSSL